MTAIRSTVRITLDDVLCLLDQDGIDKWNLLLSNLTVGDNSLTDISWNVVGATSTQESRDGVFLLVEVDGTTFADEEE